MTAEGSSQIDNVMQESRLFPPTPEFVAKAKINSADAYQTLYDASIQDTEAFWGKLAEEELHWFRPFETVYEKTENGVGWFVEGQTNISYNCLDAQIEAGRGDKVAFIWEGEPGDQRQLTYRELHREVCRMANGLKKLGIEQGDRVSIYMPMTPELPVAMLACARIGAIHSVIFGGFSAEAIAERNNDAEAKLIITADGGWRRGKVLPLKNIVDQALSKSPSIESCLVLRRTENDIQMQAGRDVWMHELLAEVDEDCPATPLDAETPLFILYTSGSTGKPKGIKHTTAGYSLYTKMSFQWVFDYQEDDIYWCTADCGWITGHSYMVYGPLANGATVLLYEGAPNHPAEDRFWDIVERHKVTILYTAPTAIRAFIKWGDEHVEKHDLSTLRLLGTVGEGINPEAWIWYHEKIGAERCPIVDTWWQTETGGIMMSPLPGAIPTKPGSCTKPLPGIIPTIVDEEGNPVDTNHGGMLCISKPWPGMLRGIWGDEARHQEQYWSKVPGMYLTGDNARLDNDGYYWIMGRIDDVINVSGHRLSTIEVESALVSHPKVAEAAAVGRPDEIKGQAIAVFVTAKDAEAGDELRQELKLHVRKEIGALAVPDDLRFTAALPKTRSGKIMRRLLRDIAAGKEATGDTTTLEDFSVLAQLRQDDE
ncbi:MAG: acetate--CoA ligase [Planctomycetota bacterium]|jgi:acetyl-CoA synthetase|nr:acetate--CoA ligase [Planctomycetota bacterium]MEC7428708.1 acetate--CoA ligase [Planctomycetota bacterium]MEC7449679.1 acetate--CoA ligase [Planctomycetota bacterium]MEC7716306.1 acetate--CoA ligase [Planctomycetota bacterium]MEC8801044.1 acetate--CoA ligase [Planctomycetota bacterium]